MPSGSSPPQASYVIDDLVPTSPQLAATTTCTANQQLFNSGALVEIGEPHHITISVTRASVDQPYILDHLWLCEAGSRAYQDTTGITPSASWTGNGNLPTVDGNSTSAPAQGTSAKDAIVITLASLLGVVTVLCVSVFIWFRIARKKTRWQESLDSSKASDLFMKNGAL